MRTLRLLSSMSLCAVLVVSAVGCSGGAKKWGKKESSAGGNKAPVARERATDTETYAHIKENSFKDARTVPLSTISIDVDTASYSNVRRFINQGQLPPKDAVRVEELVNYFPYNHAAPRGNDPVSLTTDLAVCPWNDRHLLARIALRARTIDKSRMPQRNLVFLVDTSGSMAGANRLPLLKQSLRLLVEEMNQNDRVALVAYAGSAGLVLPPTPGSDRERILGAFDRLKAGGSTAGGAGIRLAYQVAQKHFVSGGINRVILGTDGDFNVGISDTDELVRLIEEKRRSGVYLTILGFGMGNLKDNRLEQLAHHGNGHYAYIDSEAEARKVFVEQGGALVTVTKDVKLQVAFNPARVASYRLIGYENRVLQDRDFDNDRKDAGDMGSGHTVTALYELVPAGQAEVGREWLTVKMRYKDPDSEQSQLLSRELKAEPVAFEAAAEDLRFAAAVASFGMVLRESEHRGNADLAAVRRIAAGSVSFDPGGHRADFVRLVDRARDLSRERGGSRDQR
jgi:Ca-activated chloride channel homolog